MGNPESLLIMGNLTPGRVLTHFGKFGTHFGKFAEDRLLIMKNRLLTRKADYS